MARKNFPILLMFVLALAFLAFGCAAGGDFGTPAKDDSLATSPPPPPADSSLFSPPQGEKAETPVELPAEEPAVQEESLDNTPAPAQTESGPVVKPNLAPAKVPNGALYGFTQDGTYFVARALVDEAEGSPPRIRAPFTNWESVSMKLSSDGQYYFFNHPSKKGWGTLKRQFCFDIGGERYLPHALIDLESDHVSYDDVIATPWGGYNFNMGPTTRGLPFKK